MLKIKNCGPIEFKKYAKNKRIYVWGAGTALESCLDIYFSGQSVQLILDSNSKLWGKTVQHNSGAVPIGGKDLLLQHIKKHGIENSLLMITSPYYGPEIIADLDKFPELDDLECYLQVIIRATRENVPSFSFSRGKQFIPKKIHYIWIGGKPLPKEFEANIATWKKYNPDYEIIGWNESNYDFKKCDYIKEAYESKCYSFASNYARLDIVHEHGGIYLDTDVECVANFDKLLNDKAFFNMGCADRINMGCGFGSVADSNVLKDMLATFSGNHFLLQDGTPGRRSFSTFVNPILRQYGFELENYYQNINGIVLYPCEVMSPKTINGMPDFTSENTVSIHQESGTWQNDAEWAGLAKLEKFIKERVVLQ